MKIIDVHAHAFPRTYTAVIGKYLSKIPPIQEHWYWDEAKYLGEMDKILGEHAAELLNLAA
ncbi:MAG: hypothetical protein ACREQ7_18730 [Candidatus Binatia bacterium]